MAGDALEGAMMMYRDFIVNRAQDERFDGFAPPGGLPEYLFGFQRDLVEWALRKGKAAIFADCGMGKTPMQLAWADAVAHHTGGRVLILTPLAVSYQTLQEAVKFGVEAGRPGTDPRVHVTNYERLHHLDPTDYSGVVCDESSILKNFDGRRRGEITEFMRLLEFRLLCTATAAPNDYVELGTSSEALGYLGHVDMLGRFFQNDQGTCKGVRVWDGLKWRLKGHAADPFWRWVCSWSRALRRPSDLGYSDEGFDLPPLTIRDHVVANTEPLPGYLFHVPARGLKEQRAERRQTLAARCDRASELVDHDRPAVVWCHLNDEGNRLEKSIRGAVQVSGSDKDDTKERKLLGFVSGKYRVLVTKPKVAAFGLNFQHCAHHVYFPSHSFEQWYQAVRRSWRFGQTSEVIVDVVTTPGEADVLENLKRKAGAADVMFDRLVEHMTRAIDIDRSTYKPDQKMECPIWMR